VYTSNFFTLLGSPLPKRKLKKKILKNINIKWEEQLDGTLQILVHWLHDCSPPFQDFVQRDLPRFGGHAARLTLGCCSEKLASRISFSRIRASPNIFRPRPKANLLHGWTIFRPRLSAVENMWHYCITFTFIEQLENIPSSAQT
jgi:hypothetical protein